jgi:hypothetical protein
MKFLIILVIASVASAATKVFLPDPIINDGSIEATISRCDFSRNMYMYKITHASSKPRKLIVYTNGDDNDDDHASILNYSEHLIGGNEITQYNMIHTFNGNPIHRYGTISVEDETGNLLYRRVYDCNTIRGLTSVVSKVAWDDSYVYFKIMVFDHWKSPSDIVSLYIYWNNDVIEANSFHTKPDEVRKLKYDNTVECNRTVEFALCPSYTDGGKSCNYGSFFIPCIEEYVSSQIPKDFTIQSHIEQFKKRENVTVDEYLNNGCNCNVTNYAIYDGDYQMEQPTETNKFYIPNFAIVIAVMIAAAMIMLIDVSYRNR